MTERLRMELALLLPDLPGDQDACMQRLTDILGAEPGVTEAHIVPPEGATPGQLCLHFDPAQLLLAEVRRAALAAGARISARFGHVSVAVRMIGAEDAARRLVEELRAVPGVLTASINLPAQQAFVEFDRELTSLERIQEAVGRLPGVTVPNAGANADRGAEVPPWYRRHRELVWSLLSGVLLLAAYSGARWGGLPGAAVRVLYGGAYLFGGFDLVRHTVAAARRGRFAFDIDLLMLLAALGAALLGEWAEGAFLLFLFSLAHALEHYALGRARNAIRALAELAPRRAVVLRGAEQHEIPVEEVVPGDLVVIRPGERLPVDGEVTQGNSSINQAPVTGESVPVEKAPGDEVFAGTVNGEGALQVRTTRAVGDRTLDRVVTLVEEAQAQQAPTQRFTEQFERVFVPVVLIADLLLILLPPLLGFWDWSTSFYRGMALLVASSPCALALGTPAAVLAGIAQAARHGVLIKGGAHLENLGRLRALALDKTGTLTRGEPEVTDVIAFAPTPTSESELLALAAAVERHSQHPLGAAVVREADRRALVMPDIGEVTSVSGQGIRSTFGGEAIALGNLRLWEADGVVVPGEVSQAVAGLQARGRSTITVRVGTRWMGVLGLADQPRPDVREVLDQLRRLGIAPIVMLTGDNQGVGDAIGAEVGVDAVKAGLMPEDKVTAVKDLLARHGMVAMVGDGVNDAPALAHATVGIAMGGAGTAVALETADVALMADDLGMLPFAVSLSRSARGVIRQNLYLSLAVIAILIVATTTGTMGIGPAVLVHEGSTLLVIANALRLLRHRPRGLLPRVATG